MYSMSILNPLGLLCGSALPDSVTVIILPQILLETHYITLLLIKMCVSVTRYFSRALPPTLFFLQGVCKCGTQYATCVLLSL